MKKLLLAVIVIVAVMLIFNALSGSSATACNQAWDQLRGDNEGVPTLVIAMVLGRDHEKGTVGYVVKECILDGTLKLE